MEFLERLEKLIVSVGYSLFTKFADGVRGHRLDLRFLRPFRADLSIRKSSSFLPPLYASTGLLVLLRRHDQVSPQCHRYYCGTLLPFNSHPLPRTLSPTTPILSNCFSSSARRLWRVSSTRFRRSMSASTVIPDRFTFAMVISCPLAYRIVRHLWRWQILMQIELGNLA